jgi:hypothetical protein
MVVLMLRPFPSSISTYSGRFPASASTTGSCVAAYTAAENLRLLLLLLLLLLRVLQDVGTVVYLLVGGVERVMEGE